jgi:hypothetical protein
MRSEPLDPARRAVERIAASVGAPPPPEDLDARRRRPRIARAVLAVAAAAGVVLLIAAVWTLSLRRVFRPMAEGRFEVVVEHLRVNGRAVESRVVELPAAGAVIVLPGAVSHGRVEKKTPANPRIAALWNSGEEHAHDR